MVNAMSALGAILAYGLLLGATGLVLALRERSRRRSSNAVQERREALIAGMHGRLRTDAGEELDVYLQKAGQ